MKITEKQELVKNLYETYPYPDRGIKTKKEALNYVKWVTKIFGKDIGFWKGKKVLELGCGTGELANGLSLAGAKVKGIDFSKNSISKANDLKNKLNTDAQFKEKNILEFSDKKEYDIVIALGSLHHTVNARKGFRITCKHCKEEGLIIIGLYNKFSRFRQRVRRLFLWFLGGKNIEKRIFWGKKLFGGNESKSWLGDKYGQVHESYHSINELMKWFEEEKIEFIASKPNFSIPIIDELKWLFKKKNAFFVMVGSKRKRN